MYESVWSRYLSLLVGHTAYAQVLVIAIFLGGMGAGALLVGDRSEELRRPLLLYVGAEVALAALAVAFHPAYRALSRLVEEVVLPSMPGAASAGVVQWALAVALIAPQTVLLGATFPLLAAGVVRRFPIRPGWTVAVLYFVNSLGGAVGVLAAGFALLPSLGLPGALLTAAGLNLCAAFLVFVARRGPVPASGPQASGEDVAGAAAEPGRIRQGPDPEAGSGPPTSRTGSGVPVLLLAVAFFTAVASFTYQIGWIRMLSLVMGSATHSFELMLSAFILGLAIGGLVIRGHADAQVDSLRLLAGIQWLMGATALATIPLYAGSFRIMEWMVQTLPGMEGGYVLFNVLRYGIGLAVMLPSTVLAGMTLPLITGALLHGGVGERSVGWVYGTNTLGSVVGVVLAGLILLPALGLEGLLLFGSGLDMALGGGLFAVAAFRDRKAEEWTWPSRRALLLAGLALVLALVAVSGVGVGVRLDRSVLTSGVFRYGELPDEGEKEVLFYEDGRTATVGVHVWEESGLAVLTTNGKPDASLPLARLRARRAEGPPEPRVIRQADAATQLFSPLVALAHAPDAKRVANIGHGSGISGHALLGSPEVAELTTIEIEPAVFRAARAFHAANRRVYDDPRSSFAVEDARTHFARASREYDLVLSEPSNPWVSGTSSLFTVEFYRRVRDVLSRDGVLAQWFQLYEMSDRLVLTVLAGVHRVFPDYRAYLVGPRDLLVVAAADGALQPPDWSVLEYPGVASDLAYLPELTGADLEATRLFDRKTLAPLLDDWTPVNSDFRPVLDYGAERARILRETPTGIYRFATAEVDLAALLAGDRLSPAPYTPLSAEDVVPMERRATGSGLRAVLEGETTLPGPLPRGFSDAQRRLARFRTFLTLGRPPETWSGWARDFQWAAGRLQGVSGGGLPASLVDPVERYLARSDSVPPAVRGLVAFRRGLAGDDAVRAIRGAEGVLDGTLPALDSAGVEVFHDGAVAAFLRAGRASDARRVLERFHRAAGYAENDARLLLLEAWIRRVGAGPRASP